MNDAEILVMYIGQRKFGEEKQLECSLYNSPPCTLRLCSGCAVLILTISKAFLNPHYVQSLCFKVHSLKGKGALMETTEYLSHDMKLYFRE